MNLTIPPIFRIRQTEFCHISIVKTADDIGDQGKVTELLRFRRLHREWYQTVTRLLRFGGLHHKWAPDMLEEKEKQRMKTSPLHVVAAVLGISLLSVFGSFSAS